jgi:hypothetical protein
VGIRVEERVRARVAHLLDGGARVVVGVRGQDRRREARMRWLAPKR